MKMGAERLLGSGDMLYLAPSTSHLTRAQGTYVSDEEINNVIDFFSDMEPQYSRGTAAAEARLPRGRREAVRRFRSAAHDELYERGGRGCDP